MSAQHTTVNNGGIGILGVLGVVFVTLKLIGIIDWSWWFVLMPFYLIPAILLLVAGIALLVASVFD